MATPRILILACGALARELTAITSIHELDGVTVECLPAALHNHPSAIPGAIRSHLDRRRGQHDRVLLGYADCGTSGEIDAICATEGIQRLPGAHCYQVFAGRQRFIDRHDADPTAFYLTDYLAKHFKRIVMDGLGITAHPELLEAYFGNYTKVVYLAQTDDPLLDLKAHEAADLLALDYQRIDTGYGTLEEVVVDFAKGVGVPL